MSTLKSAESRPLKDEEKLEVQRTESCIKQGPSRLALLHACMNFVGGLGRILEFISKVHAWWTNNS